MKIKEKKGLIITIFAEGDELSRWLMVVRSGRGRSESVYRTYIFVFGV